MNHIDRREWESNNDDFKQDIEEHQTRLRVVISAGNRAEEGRAYKRLRTAYWNPGKYNKLLNFISYT